MASIVALLSLAYLWVFRLSSPFGFLMSAGHFPHIILGSVEIEIVVSVCNLYSIMGNVIGCMGLLTMLVYAEVGCEEK